MYLKATDFMFLGDKADFVISLPKHCLPHPLCIKCKDTYKPCLISHLWNLISGTLPMLIICQLPLNTTNSVQSLSHLSVNHLEACPRTTYQIWFSHARFSQFHCFLLFNIDNHVSFCLLIIYHLRWNVFSWDQRPSLLFTYIQCLAQCLAHRKYWIQ